jgi:hypothetical protein
MGAPARAFIQEVHMDGATALVLAVTALTLAATIWLLVWRSRRL